MVSDVVSRWIDVRGRVEAGEFDLLDDILAESVDVDGTPVARRALKAAVAGFVTAKPTVRTTFHDVR